MMDPGVPKQIIRVKSGRTWLHKNGLPKIQGQWTTNEHIL